MVDSDEQLSSSASALSSCSENDQVLQERKSRITETITNKLINSSDKVDQRMMKIHTIMKSKKKNL